MKANFPLAIHGLSPEEIRYIAELENMSIRSVIERLIAAGLDSIPGGGAEILDDEIRHADLAAQVHRPTPGWRSCARRTRLGLRTTATMVFGFGEQPRHLVGHLERLRALQDETAGFTAFICWPFQAEGTRLKLHDDTTAMRYLRMFALSRLYLDNFPSLQVSWPTMGPEVGQVGAALRRQRLRLGDDRGERRLAGGRDLQARRRRHRALHPRGRLRAAPPQHALRAAGRRRERQADGRVKSSARAGSSRSIAPPIAEGAVALDDDGTVLAVGRARRGARRVPRRAPRSAPRASLLPGLVNAHCHLELSALADAVPGGEGLIAWASDADGASREADRASAQRDGRRGRGGRGRRARHGRDRRRRQHARRRARRSARAGLRGRPVPRAARLARGRDRRRARRRRPRARRGRRRPGRRDLGYVPAPHAPYSVGPELLRAHLRRRGRAPGAPTSIHVAEDEDELALLRDGSGRLAGDAGRAWASTRDARRRGKSPVAYLASLGAFDGPAPPLLVHMVHAGADDRRIAREAGATVVLCPRSNLHIGGRPARRRARCSPTASRSRSAPTAWPRRPTCRSGARWRRWRAHFPAVPAARWLEAATRGGAARSGLRRPRHAGARRSAPACSTCWSTTSPAPLESLVRDPTPTLRWVARA